MLSKSPTDKAGKQRRCPKYLNGQGYGFFTRTYAESPEMKAARKALKSELENRSEPTLDYFSKEEMLRAADKAFPGIRTKFEKCKAEFRKWHEPPLLDKRTFPMYWRYEREWPAEFKTAKDK